MLGGCGAADSGVSQTDYDSGGAGAPIEVADAADSAALGEEAEAREVITTGSLTVVVENAIAAAEEVARLAEETGGWVSERSQHGGEEAGSAYVVVRVPAEGLSDVIEEISGLGEQRELSIGSQDVTQASRDLDARIAALETSVDRLIGLLSDAETTEALIEAESALSQRQADLEALRSERAYLSEQVAMSTLHVSLVTTPPPPTIEPGGFLGGLRTGWNSLVSFVSGVLVATGVALPWLAVLGIVTGALAALGRARSRRRRPAIAPSSTADGAPAGSSAAAPAPAAASTPASEAASAAPGGTTPATDPPQQPSPES